MILYNKFSMKLKLNSIRVLFINKVILCTYRTMTLVDLPGIS